MIEGLCCKTLDLRVDLREIDTPSPRTSSIDVILPELEARLSDRRLLGCTDRSGLPLDDVSDEDLDEGKEPLSSDELTE